MTDRDSDKAITDHTEAATQRRKRGPGLIIAIVLAAVLLVVYGFFGDYHKLYGPSKFPDRILLTWTGPTDSTQTVTWRTSLVASKGIVQVTQATEGPDFGTIAEYEATRQRLTTILGPAYYYSAEVRGLTPETTYYYRVGDGKNWSEWSRLATAAAEEKPFRFVYLGDVQNDIKSLASHVIRKAYADVPDAAFFLYAGDLINRRSDMDWSEWFYATGFIHHTIPVIATPGNHEYMNGRVCRHWPAIFEYPDDGLEETQETAYAIDYQGLRIISLDANLDPVMQADWLKEQLSDNPNRWTIALFHYPVYAATGGRDNKKIRETWQPLFDEYNVDLVLQGHDHVYARSYITHYHDVPQNQVQPGDNSGTVYVVSVAGPKKYDMTELPIFERTGEGLQLYQIIRIDGNQLFYEARTATGKTYDAFTLTQKPDGTNEFTSGLL